MKAVIVTRYGGPEVLQVKEVSTPEPEENEVLVKIHSAAVNNTDPVFRKGRPFISRFFTGLTRPKHSIPGDVLAGEIIGIGDKVTDFKKGDRIYGYSTDSLGAHAEYICLPEESAMSIIPESINYEQAAGIVDGGLTAITFLCDKAEMSKKQKVLIYGASGSVGTAAVQIAVACGADVTAVCSTPNIEMVKSLGAHRTIDYTLKDFTLAGEKYDIIFDTVAKKSFSECKKVLSDDGMYLTTFPSPEVLIKGLFQSKTRNRRAVFVAAGLRPADEKIANLEFLSELMVNGKIKAVISKNYSMDEITEAHAYVESGHKRGNAVINVI